MAQCTHMNLYGGVPMEKGGKRLIKYQHTCLKCKKRFTSTHKKSIFCEKCKYVPKTHYKKKSKK